MLLFPRWVIFKVSLVRFYGFPGSYFVTPFGNKNHFTIFDKCQTKCNHHIASFLRHVTNKKYHWRRTLRAVSMQDCNRLWGEGSPWCWVWRVEEQVPGLHCDRGWAEKEAGGCAGQGAGGGACCQEGAAPSQSAQGEGGPGAGGCGHHQQGIRPTLQGRKGRLCEGVKSDFRPSCRLKCETNLIFFFMKTGIST